MRQLLFTLCLLCSLFDAHGARAQTVDAEYERAVVAAIEQFEQRHFEDAYALFERAHELRPSARTSRGLGISAYEAQRFVDAVEHLSAALQDPRRALPQEQQEEVRDALSRANRFVSRLAVALQPEDAQLTMDGRPVRNPGKPRVVEPGLHELIVSAPERKTVTRIVRLKPGESLALAVELPAPEPERQPVETRTSRKELPAPPPSLRQRGLVSPLVAILAGELGVGAGIAAGVRALELRKQGRDRRRGLVASALTLAPAGAIVALGGALTWRMRVRAARTQAALSLLPTRTAPQLRIEMAY